MSGNRHRSRAPLPPPHLSSHAAVPVVGQPHNPPPPLPLRHPQHVTPGPLPLTEQGHYSLPEVRSNSPGTDEAVTEPPAAGSGTAENNDTDAPTTGEGTVAAKATKNVPNDLAHIERNVSWFLKVRQSLIHIQERYLFSYTCRLLVQLHHPTCLVQVYWWITYVCSPFSQRGWLTH